MAEHRDLPGSPRKRLVKQVRSHLCQYGIRPKQGPWIATWSWANAIANSYFHEHWPLSNEIASQYLLLLLAEMRQRHDLRLPYRAGKIIPPEVQKLLPAKSTGDHVKLLSDS